MVDGWADMSGQLVVKLNIGDFGEFGRVYRLFGMGRMMGRMVLRLDGQIGQLWLKDWAIGGKVGQIGF